MKTSCSVLASYLLLACVFPLSNLLAQSPLLRTYEVQGNGTLSSFNGQLIQLDTSVVTFANSFMAYVQDANGDGDPLTSDGLLIDDGNTFQLVPGDRVLITGRVSENDGQTSLASSVTINKLSSGLVLSPTPFNPGTALVNGVSPLEAYESMLLDFSLTVGQGTSSFGTPEVYAGPNRPMREPGILAPGLPGLPVFDGNPEILQYDPNGLGQSNFLFYNGGDHISGVGILEQFSFGYELSPVAPTQYDPVPVTRAVRDRQTDEITVGSINTLFLLEDESNYALHLTKVVNYIAQSMRFPDVIAIQEIGGMAEVEDLIFRLRQLHPTSGDYRGFSSPTDGFLNVAYLVNKRIATPVFTELGTNEFFSGGGFLHNRPPLLVSLQVPGSQGTQLQVLNLHIRSLNGVDTDINVRRRRNEQAISIANMVEDLRNDNLVVVGDYNAFQFTDGFVDVYNQISGLPSLGAEFPVEDIVNPPLQSASDVLSEAERYSFVFQGSAQQLDHCLYNDLTGLQASEFAFARGNSDASVEYENNAFQLPRASDHDGFVLYLSIDGLSPVTANNNDRQPRIELQNPLRAGGEVQYYDLPANSQLTLYDTWGRARGVRLQSSQVTASAATSTGTSRLPGDLTPGLYFLQLISDGQLVFTRKLLVF